MTRFAKCLIVGALCVCGFVMCSICGAFDKVTTDYLTYKVKSGDTLNGIAAKYYSLNTKGYIELDDYQMMVRLENKDKQNTKRVLQIGDVVRVPVYSVVAKKIW